MFLDDVLALGELLDRQVGLQVLHQCLPGVLDGAGVAARLAQRVHLGRAVTAPPDGCDIVRRQTGKGVVLVVARRTGLGHRVHLAVGGFAVGSTLSAVQDIPHHAVHDVRRVRADGLGRVDILVVVQDHVALVIGDLGIVVRCRECTGVEHRVRTGQLHHSQAAALGAQDQRSEVHIVLGVDIAAFQRVMDKVVQVVHTDHIADPDSHRVVRLLQCVVDEHRVALTAYTAVVGGPGAPDIAAGLGRLGEGTHDADILILQYLLVLRRVVRGVQDLGGIVDQLVVQRQRVGTDGFHRRTGLVRRSRAVEAQIVFLLADTAADAKDVAVVVQRRHGGLRADFLVHAEVLGGVVGVIRVGGGAGLEGRALVIGVDGDSLLPVDGVTVLRDGQAGGLVVLHLIPAATVGGIVAQADRLFVPQCGDEVVLVVHRLLDARLHGGVNGGVDAQTAGEDQLLRLVGGVVQVLLQLVQQLGVQGIGEPGVAGRAGRVLGGARLFGQGDSLSLGGVELGLGDIPLGVHLIQHVVAALDELLGVRGGVVLRRVLRDGGERRALGQGQILDMLAEILDGAGLHTVDDAGQRDRVQVRLKDGLLAVLVVQTQRTEDLAHLTHVVLLVIAGQVLDELLLQRGRTAVRAPDAVAGESVQRRADGALEVDAGLGAEVLVLDGDDRVLQILRHSGELTPDTVLVAGERGVLVAVDVVDDRRLAVFLVVQIEGLGVIRRDLHDIHGQQHAAHAGRHNAQAEHTADEAEDHTDDAAALFGLFLVLGCGCAGLAGGTCRRLYAICGDMALLLGFYGNRLLWSVSKRGNTKLHNAIEWIIPQKGGKSTASDVKFTTFGVFVCHGGHTNRARGNYYAKPTNRRARAVPFAAGGAGPALPCGGAGLVCPPAAGNRRAALPFKGQRRARSAVHRRRHRPAGDLRRPLHPPSARKRRLSPAAGRFCSRRDGIAAAAGGLWAVNISEE